MTFSVILADPPWRYAFSRSRNRVIENHYPTMTTQAIAALRVVEIAHRDAVLFLWSPAPKLLDALAVMQAWGFEYISNAIWDKELIGPGYWFRTQHELLLVGRRGNIRCPAPSSRRSSVFRSRRTRRHSQKPEEVQDWIDRAFPDSAKLEMFARRERPGWSVWGNEVPTSVTL